MMTAKLMHQDGAGIDSLDPSTTSARDALHLRAIIAARKAVDQADDDPRAAVRTARKAGDSWATIGLALDTRHRAQPPHPFSDALMPTSLNSSVRNR